MNVAARIVEEPAQIDRAIVATVEANPVLVLIEPEKFEPFFEAIRQEVAAHVPDLITKKGRDAIKSLAFKVVRTKTAIDDAGKKLNESARAQINKVDASRRDMKARLEALADEARRPLTVWEEAEEDRIKSNQSVVSALRTASEIAASDTAAMILERIEQVREIVIAPADFQDETDAVLGLRDSTVAALQAAFCRLEKAEADRAELERLRAAEAERQRVEAERAAQAEAEHQAKIRAEVEEARRVAEAKAAEERIASAAKRAEENAKAEAERKAAADREALERKHADALRAEQQKVAEAEAWRRDKEEQIARRQAEEAAEAKRVADEQAAREADQAHRARVMSAAKKAIMTCGCDEEIAKKIVAVIQAGAIPHISIQF